MFLRPQHFDLVASGLPERVVWKLLRLKRATRLAMETAYQKLS